MVGAVKSWITCDASKSRSSMHRLVQSFLRFIFLLFAIAYMRCSLSSFNGITTVTTPTHPLLPQIEAMARPFHVWSQYGLFRRMTGVGAPYSHVSVGGQPPAHVARPELVVEGYDASTKKWRSIEFAYKPTTVSAMPRVVLPHQPRLDWQMWFAALGNYQHNPWLVHLLAKLMQPDTAAVRALFDPTTNPFHDKPPAMMRITRYEYDFTRWNTSWNRMIPNVEIVSPSSNMWWARRNGDEYLPEITVDHPSVAEFLRHHHISIRAEVAPEVLYSDCRLKGERESNVVMSGVLRIYVCEAIKLRDLITRTFLR